MTLPGETSRHRCEGVFVQFSRGRRIKRIYPTTAHLCEVEGAPQASDQLAQLPGRRLHAREGWKFVGRDRPDEQCALGWQEHDERFALAEALRHIGGGRHRRPDQLLITRETLADLFAQLLPLAFDFKRTL